MTCAATWQEQDILVACGDGVSVQPGHVYGPVGISILSETVWSVTHLNTGLAICELRGSLAEVRPIVVEIAGWGDWGFSTRDGWRNLIPTLPMLVRRLIERDHQCMRASDDVGEHHQEVVRKIVAIRSGEAAA